MDLKLQHVVIRTTDIKTAKDFYVNKLGLVMLEEAENFFAAIAGGVRLSFFGGYERQEITEDAKTGVSLILRTKSLDEATKTARDKGIPVNGDVIDISGFHKFLEIEDPDGNILFLAEYEKEPV
jgi:catechol 2,3-dioxygenase-like lactoylglutathione lyase family enzyme